MSTTDPTTTHEVAAIELTLHTLDLLVAPDTTLGDGPGISIDDGVAVVQRGDVWLLAYQPEAFIRCLDKIFPNESDRKCWPHTPTMLLQLIEGHPRYFGPITGGVFDDGSWHAVVKPTEVFNALDN